METELKFDKNIHEFPIFLIFWKSSKKKLSGEYMKTPLGCYTLELAKISQIRTLNSEYDQRNWGIFSVGLLKLLISSNGQSIERTIFPQTSKMLILTVRNPPCWIRVPIYESLREYAYNIEDWMPHWMVVVAVRTVHSRFCHFIHV